MYCNFLLLIFYSFMLPVWYMHNPNLTSIKLDAIHVHVSVHTQGVALWRGDMALFGDLAIINKMVLYIVTQQISLWIRLCRYVCEMHGSDVTITVRARIHKHYPSYCM